MSTQIPLSLPRDPEEIQTAFDGDTLDRKKFAENITPALLQLAVNGGVMTLDAPWGEGKSWFGRNWNKMLEDQGQVQTCWIDAFEQDYIENPFELLAAELVDAMGWRDDEELIGKTVQVMSFAEKTFGAVAKVVGSGIGFMVSAQAAQVGIPSELKAGEAVAGAAADLAAQSVANGNAWVKDRLLAHSKEKMAIRGFRKALQEQLDSQEKPMVVFVDELDRCRPDFAVRLLECIKHFFDVPKLVFVLLLNRIQLEKAIKGVYGSEVDATRYLSKFVHLQLALPLHLDAANSDSLDFILDALKRFGLPFRQESKLPETIKLISGYLGLSKRELQRVMPVLALVKSYDPITAYLSALHIQNPSILNGIANNSLEAHQSCFRRLEYACVSASHSGEMKLDLANCLLGWHSLVNSAIHPRVGFNAAQRHVLFGAINPVTDDTGKQVIKIIRSIQSASKFI
jgi:hypothetical protein